MAYNEYLENLKQNRTKVNCFLTNKTMLTGKVEAYDALCVIIDECLVTREQMISIKVQK